MSHRMNQEHINDEGLTPNTKYGSKSPDKVNLSEMKPRRSDDFSLHQKSGFFNGDDYVKNYCHVCHLCSRRYSSITGLNYHLNNFNHKNPPPNYDPHQVSKRGRPRGYRPKSHYNTSRMQFDTIHINHKDYTSRSGRRVNRPREIYNKPFPRHSSLKKLTYAESQRVIEIEQNNYYHRISVDEHLDLIKNEPGDIPLHPKNGISKRQATIPHAEFSILESYENPDHQPNPILERSTYVQSLEVLESSDAIEYEIDEEDTCWLEILSVNPQNGIDKIQPEIFEYLMDRLEKESEFIVKNPDGTIPGSPDDDVVCAVCFDGDCSNTNLIVFCDICNVAVHQDCYGLPYVPEGQWLCRRCSHAPSKEIDCALCPVKSGVFKQIAHGGWCHIICAVLIPGAKFINSVFLEPIDISDISHTRFNVRCKICNETKGAVIQCCHPHCAVSFHVTCAQAAGLLYIERTEISPSDENSLPHVDHRYLSYCAKHYPVPKDQLKVKNNVPLKTHSIEKHNPPTATIHVPVVSDELINRLAEQLDFPSSLEIVKIVKRYWQIKRYLRSGVPLLRRRSFLPKHPASSFKLTDKQLLSIETTSDTVLGLKTFTNYLEGFIKGLDLVKTREDFKRKRTDAEKQLFHSTLQFEDAIDHLLHHINSTLNGEIKIDRDSIVKNFCKLFKTSHIRNLKDFTNFLINVFQRDFIENQTSDELIQLVSKSIKNCILGLNIEFDETPSEIKQKRPHIKKAHRKKSKNSSVFLSKSFDIIPSNIDTLMLAQNLTQGLPDGEDSDILAKPDEPNIDLIVWAHLGKIKHFPAKVVAIHNETSQRDKNGLNISPFVQLQFFDKEKTIKWVDWNQIVLLGASANIDTTRITQVLNSKSYNRDVKKDFLEIYQNIRGINLLNIFESFQKAASNK